MEYRIYGASDDRVEVEGSNGFQGEIDCYNCNVEVRLGSWPGWRACVFASYAFAGCGWIVGIRWCGDDGEETVPDGWSVTIESGDCDYSPTLVVRCPAGIKPRYRYVYTDDSEPTEWKPVS